MNDSNAHRTPLNDGDLSAYIEGDASLSIVALIESDQTLLAEVAALRQAEALLDAGLARADCPETDTLLLFQAKLLAEDDLLQAHVASCAYCAQELQALTVGIELDAEPVATVESEWIAALKAAGRSVIRLNLLPTRPAFALRGSSRQLVFESEGFQAIVVVKQDAVTKWQIEGQVVNLGDPLTVPSGKVLLRQSVPVVQDTLLNEFGHFVVESVAAGDYTLQIDVDSQTSLIVQTKIPLDGSA